MPATGLRKVAGPIGCLYDKADSQTQLTLKIAPRVHEGDHDGEVALEILRNILPKEHEAMAELMANDDACERLDKEALQRVKKAKERIHCERMPFVTEVQQLASEIKKKEAAAAAAKATAKNSADGST